MNMVERLPCQKGVSLVQQGRSEAEPERQGE